MSWEPHVTETKEVESLTHMGIVTYVSYSCGPQVSHVEARLQPHVCRRAGSLIYQWS